VFRHAGLDKDPGGARVDPGRQPVHDHVIDAVAYDLGGFVLRGQGMPVGDEEKTLVFILQLEPVPQDAMIMAQVQLPRGPHAG